MWNWWSGITQVPDHFYVCELPIEFSKGAAIDIELVVRNQQISNR